MERLPNQHEAPPLADALLRCSTPSQTSSDGLAPGARPTPPPPGRSSWEGPPCSLPPRPARRRPHRAAPPPTARCRFRPHGGAQPAACPTSAATAPGALWPRSGAPWGRPRLARAAAAICPPPSARRPTWCQPGMQTAAARVAPAWACCCTGTARASRAPPQTPPRTPRPARARAPPGRCWGAARRPCPWPDGSACPSPGGACCRWRGPPGWGTVRTPSQT
mmetsp:Transcript_36712/g.93836  ORF Transcript_36712/g.93836 Transcript_36712/m.93836 type:complete len:221 (-) Transcript_36712:163-825(-)